MKHALFSLVLASSFVGISSSQASVTNVVAYGQDLVNCYAYSLGSPGDVFTMDSIQSGPGGIRGWIYTDSASDPTLTLQNSINNDTGFDWTGYHVDVFMNQTFTLSSPSVLNTGWTGTITAQPTWNGSQYVGQLDFTGGVPVTANQLLTFSYQITFSGATSFMFGQTLTPVPEPSPAGLWIGGGLLIGGLGSILKRRTNRQTASSI